MSKTLGYEVWIHPTKPRAAQCLLGRYESQYLADRCAGLIRACVTEGEIVVKFNHYAEASS
jgi:hypothetical protein